MFSIFLIKFTIEFDSKFNGKTSLSLNIKNLMFSMKPTGVEDFLYKNKLEIVVT
jgi:hypothetical protein